MPEISIILPTYNEAKNISELIPALEAVIRKNRLDAEIVVVDDNSPDGTAETAEKLNKKFKNIRVLKRQEKEGIGAAVSEAYGFAKGKILLSMDSDQQIAAEDIMRLLKHIPEYDFVFGSKYLKPQLYQKEGTAAKIRYIISRAGNRYIGIANGVPFMDYSLNFRALKRKVWQAISPEDKRNFFFAEMIVQAHRKGFRLKEVPIEFRKRRHGDSKTMVMNQMSVFLVKGLLLAFRR
ncbi:MAG: glycosyltransferase [Candidatus Diapherotrites archaeon]|nr:glycosyltransferase [Candidatus Diapherotrites archaeon]